MRKYKYMKEIILLLFVLNSCYSNYQVIDRMVYGCPDNCTYVVILYDLDLNEFIVKYTNQNKIKILYDLTEKFNFIGREWNQEYYYPINEEGGKNKQ